MLCIKTMCIDYHEGVVSTLTADERGVSGIYIYDLTFGETEIIQKKR